MQLWQTSDVRAVGRFVARGTHWAACTVVGFSLVGVGLAGLVLPVLPGWLLIIAGFALLSREYAWAKSGLTFARRHAVRGSTKLRALTRGRDRGLSTEEVSGLEALQAGADEAARRAGDGRRASNLG